MIRMRMKNKIKSLFDFRRYISDERAMSFTETAILFPILLSMLMAVYDLGQGVVVNQKTVAASQIMADLVTRNEIVSMDLIEDIVNAGELALAPYSTEGFGYDIASIEFGEEGDAEVLWRVTENMEQGDAAIDSTEGLGEEGEGVVVVSVVYAYEPYFANFIVDSINMNELAFLRGRKSLVVGCTDCP